MEIFDPTKFLSLVFGKDFFKGRLLNSELELKQLALQSILKATSLSKREVEATIYKVVDKYEEKMKKLKKEKVKAFRKMALNNEVLLKERLEGLIVWNEVQEIKKENKGGFYRWLPSSSKEPDPEHQLLYGKIFKIGEGDKHGNMPCERYGCKCGMQLLTEKEAKELKGRLKNGI